MAHKVIVKKNRVYNKKEKALVSKTDWKRLEKIRAGQERINTSDIPEADEQFWEGASVGLFENKTSLSVRFDSDVVRWFKNQGPKYQTRMNNVLRVYMNWKQGHKQQRRA